MEIQILTMGLFMKLLLHKNWRPTDMNFFYNNDKKRGEVDFLIEQNGYVVPIEVESGKDYRRHSALSQLMSNANFNIESGYVLCNGNLEKKDNIYYLPIYMISFFKKKKEEKQIINLDISSLI